MNTHRSMIFKLLVSLCSFGYPAAAQNGVTVIDSLNQRHGGPSPSYGFYFASCWGYVAPDGHEYALLGCYSGTSIIDIDTTPIHEIAYVPGANSPWKEIKVWGNYAYAVSENSAQGLQIIDLQYLPDSAHLVRSLFTIGPRNVANSHTVSVADGYLYLNGGSSVGTTIYSLADPVNPVYVGQFQTAYVHDSYIRNDTLLAAAINGQGLYVVSVANKAAPVQLGLITYASSGTHNAWLHTSGRYVFTSDEVNTTPKTMKVWDIQNLPSFTQLTPFQPSPTTVIHNVHGRGQYVYVAHYRSGVFVADVHDPAAIVNAGGYNTYRGGGTDPNYTGCWGVYPYFPSGKWIASDTQTGLYVLRFTGLTPRSRSPLLLPSDGDTIAPGAAQLFRWRRAAIQTEDPHYYQLHVFGPGVDTLIRTVDTSLSVGGLTGYEAGQQYRWHVWIKDEFTAVSSQDTFEILVSPGSETRQYSVNEGWNIASLPLMVADSRASVVFPSAISTAFAFDTSGYVARDTLKNGEGYWIKFSSAKNVSITGMLIEEDSIAVRAGWNLIGSISGPVAIGSIVQIPPGVVESNYFRYSGLYSVADTLQPGMGYWVKTNQNGKLVLR